MEEDGKEQAKSERGEVELMLVFYGLIFPFMEIMFLTHVIATVIDPLYPEFNTAFGLMVPALMPLAMSVFLALNSYKKLRRIGGYLSIATMIILSLLLSMETNIMFPASIAGFVVDSNLWSLVTLNIVIYFLSVVLAIVGIRRSQPAD